MSSTGVPSRRSAPSSLTATRPPLPTSTPRSLHADNPIGLGLYVARDENTPTRVLPPSLGGRTSGRGREAVNADDTDGDDDDGADGGVTCGGFELLAPVAAL
jgi:hypothetical protein